MKREKGGRISAEEAVIKFTDEFDALRGRHSAWTAWTDFIDLSADILSFVSERREDMRAARMESYRRIVGKYKKEDRIAFGKLIKIMGGALGDDPDQDFLGTVYDELNFGNRWRGEYFTSWDVAQTTARILFGDDALDLVNEKGFVTARDEACGAGCQLLASLSHFRNIGINCRTSAFFIAQDVDPTVAKMCYLQLSLLGCAGYVAIGNRLSEPIGGTELEPEYLPENLWFTPPYYSDYWTSMRVIRNPNGPTAKAFMKEMEELNNGKGK